MTTDLQLNAVCTNKHSATRVIEGCLAWVSPYLSRSSRRLQQNGDEAVWRRGESRVSRFLTVQSLSSL